MLFYLQIFDAWNPHYTWTGSNHVNLDWSGPSVMNQLTLTGYTHLPADSDTKLLDAYPKKGSYPLFWRLNYLSKDKESRCSSHYSFSP
jgi:hypothetical protein